MTDQKESLGALPFVIAGLSFIPLIGIIFGIFVIVWGLVTTKSRGKVLALVGVVGILFSIFLYGSLFYFGAVQRGGIYDELRSTLAQTTLNSAVQQVEFYKLQYGEYPESLEILKKSYPPTAMVFVNDPTDVNFTKSRNFFYEKIDSDHYYLLGVGQDGQAFTKDDVLPKILLTPKSKIGLVIKAI